MQISQETVSVYLKPDQGFPKEWELVRLLVMHRAC